MRSYGLVGIWCGFTAISFGMEAKADSIWSHNGSFLVLQSQGAQRELAYETVKPSLQGTVKIGDRLFTGTRSGQNYSGTMRQFSAICGLIEFPVQGGVVSGQTTIQLHGSRPIRDKSCAVVGSKAETFTFRYVRSAKADNPPVAAPKVDAAPPQTSSLCPNAGTMFDLADVYSEHYSGQPFLACPYPEDDGVVHSLARLVMERYPVYIRIIKEIRFSQAPIANALAFGVADGRTLLWRKPTLGLVIHLSTLRWLVMKWVISFAVLGVGMAHIRSCRALSVSWRQIAFPEQ